MIHKTFESLYYISDIADENQIEDIIQEYEYIV
jgi:hypothetical protein